MAERHFNTTLVPGLAEFFGQTEKDKSRLSDLKFVSESLEVFHSFRILFAGLSPLLRDVFKENDVVDQSDITAITLPTSYAAISKLHDMILKRPEVEENNETPENLEELIGLLGITMTSYASSKTNSSMAAPKATDLWKRRKVFQCDSCNKEYLKESCYLNHLEVHNQEVKVMKRLAIKREKENRQQSQPYLASSDPDKRPKRLISRPKRFDLDMDDNQILDLYRDSDKKLSSSSGEWKCSKCEKTFSSKYTLENHLKLHQMDRRFYCNQCDQNFVTASVLKNHKKIHAGEIARFPCPHCDKVLNNSSNLTRHIRARHFDKSDKKQFGCSTCHKTFKDPSALRGHEKIHSGARPFSCDSCPKAFVTASQLRVHNRIHTGERPYACEECDKKFITRAHLKSHRNFRHLEVKLSKDNLCPECGAAFVKKYDLRVHMMKHTGELPYACSDCGKSFRALRNLKTHKRTHTGEKPFRCETCGRTFRNSSGIRHHFKTSEGCRDQAKTTTASSSTSTADQQHVEAVMFMDQNGQQCFQLVEDGQIIVQNQNEIFLLDQQNAQEHHIVVENV